MVSRIRSQTPRVEDAGSVYEQRSRTLMDLVLHCVSHQPSSADDRKQTRILTRLAIAMMAALRAAPREKSRIYLSDLVRLNDAQFEQVVEGLHYMRSNAKPLDMSGRRGDQPH